jgi:hypothetical protein
MIHLLNSCFPNVTKQLKILLDVIVLVVEETGQVRIATLEGEEIWWKRYKNIQVWFVMVSIL